MLKQFLIAHIFHRQLIQMTVYILCMNPDRYRTGYEMMHAVCYACK